MLEAVIEHLALLHETLTGHLASHPHVGLTGRNGDGEGAGWRAGTQRSRGARACYSRGEYAVNPRGWADPPGHRRRVAGKHGCNTHPKVAAARYRKPRSRHAFPPHRVK